MNRYGEERVAELLRRLPAPPEAWIAAATELPRARKELDGIVARAEQDAAFRAALIADLEAALVAEGYEPRPLLVEKLRRRFRTI
jgi:hypothetical protein